MKKLIAITALLAICCGSAFAGWSPWNWSFKWGQGQGVAQYVDLLPVLSWSPSTFTFANTSTGRTRSQIVTLSNTGNDTAEQIQASITGGGSSVFSIYSTQITVLSNLSSARTKAVKVRFAPPVQGQYSSSLTLTWPNQPNLNARVYGSDIINAPPTSYSYSRSITIDHTQCGSSDSSSFPVLVSLSDTTLKSVGNGGHVQNSNGYDIQFFSDSGLTTRLPAEREIYNASTGQYIGWVQVPTVSHSTNTVIYIGYGDSGISSDPNSDATYGAAKVWDTNFKLVEHFGDGTTLSLADSTSNANTGTNSGATATTGKVGGGVATIAGSSQKITAADLLSGATTATLSGWVYRSSTSNAMGFGRSGATGNQFCVQWNGSSIYFNVEHDDDAGGNYPSYALAGTGWHFVCVTFDGSLTQSSRTKGYLDGALQTLTPGGAGNPTALSTYGALNWFIGYQSDSGYLTGAVDELRASNTARSADWILTEYNNQNAPGNIGTPGFYTVGSE